MVLAACATGDGDVPDLEPRQRLVIDPAATKTVLEASIVAADGKHAGVASLPMRGGDFVVHVERAPDGEELLVLDDMRLVYEDVVLPPAYFHQGQILTGIVAVIPRPLLMRAVRTIDGVVWGAAKTDVRLAWNLRIDGEDHHLLSQTLPELEFELVMSADGGRLRADLSVLRHGVMWTWANTITLGELEVQAVAFGGAID